MLQSARYERIARDLETLPPELHESVLVDLEFEQLIRLSVYAGPRLIWSLENSPSPWGKFFRGGMEEWRLLLRVTDQARKLCFRTPRSKDDRPEIFQYPSGSLAFIHYTTSDWSAHPLHPWHPHMLWQLDRPELLQLWFTRLKDSGIGFRFPWGGNYPWLVEPWVSRVEGAAEIIEKVRMGPPSIEELAEFIEASQKVRIVRAEDFAAQLNRLADLYEAQPRHLKCPCAPQSPRSNTKHVPFQMRCEARKVVRRARNSWWGTPQFGLSRFKSPLPPIVPYDRSLKMFNKSVGSLKRPGSIGAQETEEKVEAILQDWPDWVTVDGVCITAFLKPCRQGFIGHGTLANNARPPLPVSERTLKWLENIIGIIAWIEENFPNELGQEVVGITPKVE